MVQKFGMKSNVIMIIMFYSEIFLVDYVLQNCMKFHSFKCNVLMVSKLKMQLLNILLLVQFHYSMDTH